MEESVHDIPTKLWQRKKYEQLPVNMKLGGIIILEQGEIMTCILYYIQIYMRFLDIEREWLMSWCTK